MATIVDAPAPTSDEKGTLAIQRNDGGAILTLDQAAVQAVAQTILELREGVGHAMKALGLGRHRNVADAMSRLQRVDGELAKFEGAARAAASRMRG